MITLAPNSLYLQIDTGATGTAANAPFNAWTITDIYPGCGLFWKYAITGTTANLNKLAYPEPGLTLSVHCTTINDCLNVRVINTGTPGIINFELQLYP